MSYWIPKALIFDLKFLDILKKHSLLRNNTFNLQKDKDEALEPVTIFIENISPIGVMTIHFSE